MSAIAPELLTRGVAEIIVESELRAKLNAGKKLRLKQGFDPSRADMHIGHAVGLRKLKKFQDLGHTIVLIVGDWTAQIGDPSGRDATRPRLTAEKVRENAQTYMEQFFRVIDRDKQKFAGRVSGSVNSPSKTPSTWQGALRWHTCCHTIPFANATKQAHH